MALQGLFIIVLLLNRARLRRTQVALQAEHERYLQSESVVDRLQGRLAKFSKERTLGAMATGIAHEINQPLIAIQNYAQAAKRRLQSDVDQTSKLDELVTKIEQQAGRAGDIIQRIRTLVSSDETDLHPVQLDSLVEEVIQIPLTGLKDRGCLIDLSSAADLPAVLADGLQIQLVLVNLIHNAMQSMEASEEKVDKFISIDIRQLNNREQQVSVADRGPGIPADRVDSLFEPFYSDKANGMGIGLAICRSIIEAHGGRIGYTPNPAGGSMFQFTLPVATA
jgi:C4-dicarboxylate-specific signal transduction histidine kinase